MKDMVDSPSQLFFFDVLAQLVNVPAKITLYELLKLWRNTRVALWEALADAEVFVKHVEDIQASDNPKSL